MTAFMRLSYPPLRGTAESCGESAGGGLGRRGSSPGSSPRSFRGSREQRPSGDLDAFEAERNLDQMEFRDPIEAQMIGRLDPGGKDQGPRSQGSRFRPEGRRRGMRLSLLVDEDHGVFL